jgi:hypothetical protein
LTGDNQGNSIEKLKKLNYVTFDSCNDLENINLDLLNMDSLIFDNCKFSDCSVSKGKIKINHIKVCIII